MAHFSEIFGYLQVHTSELETVKDTIAKYQMTDAFFANKIYGEILNDRSGFAMFTIAGQIKDCTVRINANTAASLEGEIRKFLPLVKYGYCALIRDSELPNNSSRIDLSVDENENWVVVQSPSVSFEKA